jgi:hypothetical protein
MKKGVVLSVRGSFPRLWSLFVVSFGRHGGWLVAIVACCCCCWVGSLFAVMVSLFGRWRDNWRAFTHLIEKKEGPPSYLPITKMAGTHHLIPLHTTNHTKPHRDSTMIQPENQHRHDIQNIQLAILQRITRS